MDDCCDDCCGSNESCDCCGCGDCCGSNESCDCCGCGDCCGSDCSGGFWTVIIILGIIGAIINVINQAYITTFGEDAMFAGIVTFVIIITAIVIVITIFVLKNRKKTYSTGSLQQSQEIYRKRIQDKQKKEETKSQKRLEKEAKKKIKKMMRVSTRIRIEMMRETIGLDSKTFNDKIWDWADKFGFTIDGDYVIVENADIDGFIDDLDKQFDDWSKQDKSKAGKI